MFEITVRSRNGLSGILSAVGNWPHRRNEQVSRIGLVFFIFSFLGATMAQGQESLDDLEKRRRIAEAEKAAISAEIARDIERKKQSELTTPVDPTKKANEEAIEAANSAKATAEAKKSQSDAESAAFKAKFGEIPDAGIRGSVELGDKAGSMETALLAARAIEKSGESIADAVKDSLKESTVLLIFPAGEAPDLKALSGFRALRPTLLNQFTQALTASERAKRPSVEVPIVPAIGVALSTVTKLLSFFASDFKVGGSELTADSALLAEVVGGKIRPLLKTDTEVRLKTIFSPIDPSTYEEFFAAELKPLSDMYATVLEAIRDREHDISILTEKLTKITGDTPQDHVTKLSLSEGIKLHQSALEKLRSTTQAYEMLMSKLLGPDGGLEVLVRQFEVSSLLNGNNSYVLLVKTHKAGGSHYVEKNLWTSFGSMPFKVMGGVVVSYSLFKGKAGNLVLSGVVPVHGGFQKVKNLEKLFQ